MITLLSDFGLADAYVGIMKGVILSIAPAARLVDLTHAIPPQAVAVGALVLRSAVSVFPSGTVHLAVVDPGVGTARAAIAVRTAGAVLVGPDNGLLAPAATALGGPLAVHAIENPALRREPVSATFHGRDVFAPAAAYLAAGAAVESLGPARAGLEPLPLPPLAVGVDEVRGVVVHVDRFGNLLTNVERAAVRAFRHPPSLVRVGEMAAIPLRHAYGDVAPGAPVAVWSSWDTVEIAVRDGSAAERFGVGRGAAVTVAAG